MLNRRSVRATVGFRLTEVEPTLGLARPIAEETSISGRADFRSASAMLVDQSGESMQHHIWELKCGLGRANTWDV